jgi:hypothetical protein
VHDFQQSLLQEDCQKDGTKTKKAAASWRYRRMEGRVISESSKAEDD